jgi:sugar phosphate isomerase/epimerase
MELSPLEMLEWVAQRGGEGVQFSEGNQAFNTDPDAGMLQEFAEEARSRNLYLEWGGGQHVPFDTTTWREKDLLAGNRAAAESAHALDVHVVRSCSGGFFRWENAAPDTNSLVEAMAKALPPQRAIFEDLGVTLAIELHFEFTTFELLRLFEMCDAEPGGWLGICLDTFNMLPMLEDPVSGTERVLPWVVATHLKDGAATIAPDGLVTFPTALGGGSVNLRAILDLLDTTGQEVNLSIEGHGGKFTTAIFDDEFMNRFPDLTPAEMERLLGMGRLGRGRLESGSISPTERVDWPDICEERTEADLRYLREMVVSLSP